MKVGDYKRIATEIATKYLNDRGDLLKIASAEIKSAGITPNRHELNRLSEYINGAVQVGLFTKGARLEPFTLVTPEALSQKLSPTADDNILEIQDHLPETNAYRMPVTSNQYERHIQEQANKVRREEYIQRRAVADKIEGDRVKGQIKALIAKRERLNREVADGIASIARDIDLAPNDSGARMIRIVRVTMMPKVAALIEGEVENERAKIANFTDYGEVNKDTKFYNKVQEVEKTAEELESVAKKISLYVAATRREA